MNEKIKIRFVTEEDAQELVEIYRPYVMETAISFEYEVPSVEEFQSRIRKITSKYPYLAAEREGKLLGYAYAASFKERKAYDWAVETTIYIRKEERRNGIGKQLYEKLEECLLSQGILNVNACIAEPEQEDKYLTMDSIRFHEHCGYQMVGKFHNIGCKFQKWYHMVWMEKQIGDHYLNPQEVRPFQKSIFEQS